MIDSIPPEIEKALQVLEPWLPWLTGLSIALALVSILALPPMVALVPRDYFVAPRRPQRHRGPLLWIFWILRNTLAVILIVAGLGMTVLPGQGLLTMLIGIMVSNFPGKYRLERWLVRQKGVFRSINWIRARAGRPSMYYPTPGGRRFITDEDAE